MYYLRNVKNLDLDSIKLYLYNITDKIISYKVCEHIYCSYRFNLPMKKLFYLGICHVPMEKTCIFSFNLQN